jgi:Mn2+/Fe2+ NRAMP family transporter
MSAPRAPSSGASAASSELAGVDRLVSLPLAAVGLSVLVLRSGVRSIERILLVLATTFSAHIAAGLLAPPDWGAAAEGLLVPTFLRARMRS